MPAAGLEQELQVNRLEDYSSIEFDITGLPDSIPAFMELLNKQDVAVERTPVVNGSATFKFLKPAEYFARLIIDRDSNMTYTSGRLLEQIQPEEVYYYSKKLKLKKNWDIKQSWNINELPVDQQKPAEIKKNKPPKKKGEEDFRDDTDLDDEEEDEFYQDDFFNPGGNRGNSRNSRNRGNSRNSNYNNTNFNNMNRF